MEAYTRFVKRYNEADDTGKQLQIRDFAKWLRLQQPDTSSLEEINSICMDSDERKAVASAKVVLSTLNSAGSSLLKKAAQSRFKLAILDEAR